MSGRGRREAWRSVEELVAERKLRFPVSDVADFAETPVDAYKDIVPMLRACAARKRKPADALVVYDPYFADGGVAARLRRLGFPRVVNRNRDFYRDVKRRSVPEHDVLLTNPPYSADHIEKIVVYCVAASRRIPPIPFALLLPTYVLAKSYWLEALKQLSPPPFYVVPHRRYAYLPPAWALRGERRDNTSVPITTAPFHTGWFVWLPAAASGEKSSSTTSSVASFDTSRVDVFFDADAVTSDHRDVTDPNKKRPNPRTRRKRKAERARRAAGYGGSSEDSR